MFCPKCGKDAGDAKFCPECGEKIPTLAEPAKTTDDTGEMAQPTAVEPPQPEKKSKKKVIVITAVTAVILTAAIVMLILFGGSNQPKELHLGDSFKIGETEVKLYSTYKVKDTYQYQWYIYKQDIPGEKYLYVDGSLWNNGNGKGGFFVSNEGKMILNKGTSSEYVTDFKTNAYNGNDPKGFSSWDVPSGSGHQIVFYASIPDEVAKSFSTCDLELILSSDNKKQHYILSFND